MANFINFKLSRARYYAAPETSASIELRDFALLLTETDEASFSYWLQEWHEKWKEFLAEKSFDAERKQFTIHSPAAYERL